MDATPPFWPNFGIGPANGASRASTADRQRLPAPVSHGALDGLSQLMFMVDLFAAPSRSARSAEESTAQTTHGGRALPAVSSLRKVRLTKIRGDR